MDGASVEFPRCITRTLTGLAHCRNTGPVGTILRRNPPERITESRCMGHDADRPEDYTPVFNDLVFRSLEPVCLGVFVLYTVFVLMGFLDAHTTGVRLIVVSTDALSAVIFLALFLALRRGMLSSRWINPICVMLALIGMANVLLAFHYVQDSFYLIYLPMIIVCYGALLLSLQWLLINVAIVFLGTAVFAAPSLPEPLRYRYFPALVGATILATIILYVRRRGVIAAQRALAAARGELENRLQVEAQLAHSQRLDSLGKLVSGIAHEFNNLLMVIIGYADQLVTTRRGAPEEKDLVAIRDAGERAAALSAKLLAFSRQQVMKTRVAGVNEIIRTATPLVERSLTGDIALHVDLDAGAGRVSVDTLQIEQVLLNLALNARDAMAESGGTLTISTAGAPDREAVEITVSDSGSGMSPEIKARAFEPFFTTKPQGSGTGLGLATVYGIVTQSGGSIDVESAPGQGSTFRITLPRVESPESGRDSVDASGERASLTLTGTVLVVDDEPNVRDVVTKTLENLGCRVIAADSGAAALELAATRAFDVVLTDIIMPGMSGIELVETLRRDGFQQRVIYMTGHGADDEARAAAHGPLLRKPFRSHALITALADALEPARA
ncbi:MAG: ATP-binding protein [Pseudomonadota bacterium]